MNRILGSRGHLKTSGSEGKCPANGLSTISEVPSSRAGSGIDVSEHIPVHVLISQASSEEKGTDAEGDYYVVMSTPSDKTTTPLDKTITELREMPMKQMLDKYKEFGVGVGVRYWGVHSKSNGILHPASVVNDPEYKGFGIKKSELKCIEEKGKKVWKAPDSQTGYIEYDDGLRYCGHIFKSGILGGTAPASTGLAWCRGEDDFYYGKFSPKMNSISGERYLHYLPGQVNKASLVTNSKNKRFIEHGDGQLVKLYKDNGTQPGSRYRDHPEEVIVNCEFEGGIDTRRYYPVTSVYPSNSDEE